MKVSFLITILFMIGSCADHTSPTATSQEMINEQSNSVKVGGLYLLKNEDSTFYITKIVAMDTTTVHLRTYSDTFKIKPSSINSENLTVLIGHSPVDMHGFLLEKPELLKVEDVKESELEGYKIYLDAMQK